MTEKEDKEDFDVKKWADKNGELAKKSFERWKEDNLKESSEDKE